MEIFKKAHGYLGATIEIRRDFLIQARKSADGGLSFIKQVVTISGVIAGFGFTAINNIESKNYFIFGELVLFINICLGLYFLKKFWYGDFEVFNNDIKRMNDIANTLKDSIEQKDQVKAEKGIGELDDFAQQRRDAGKIFKFLPTFMIILLLISATLILLSFYC